MNRLIPNYLPVFLIALGFAACGTARKPPIFPEATTWENTVLDSDSRVLQIADDKRYRPAGQLIFKQYCAICHGQRGGGDVGPNLTDAYWLHGGRPIDIASTITYGVPKGGMRSWQSLLSPGQVGAVVAYLGAIQGTRPKNAKGPEGVKQ